MRNKTMLMMLEMHGDDDDDDMPRLRL